MLMHIIISPQVRVILGITAPLSFLFWKLKRLRSIPGQTPNDIAPSSDDEMETVETEASSSADTEASSLAPAVQDYDVFLSFRGEDTRNNFVSHLYERLIEKGIHTFKDDRELERGKSIAGALPEAIKKSRMAIVVFSENYACSSWCLDELVEIVKWKKVNDRFLILPVFYKINPSDIEEQTGVVAKAFVEHKKKCKGEEIQKWKKALSEVATVSGWDSKNRFDDVDLVKCIVREVSTKLNYAASPSFEDLVDIDSHVSRIEKLLDFKGTDIRMIGIWGIGGIGKTTIANSIFHKHDRNRESDGFHSSCFLQNVKDKHRKDGDIGLQKEFLFQLLRGFDANICTVADGCNLIRNRLCQKKVLIVLDDVDDLKQLNILVKTLEWFGHGSRIIITTRDKHLLDVKEARYIYEVQPLNFCASLELFSKHAFHKDQPENNFRDLSKGFVTYAQGLPLALKVLGTFLYGLKMHEWQSELEKLNRFSNPDIHQVLKVSYDGLKDGFTKKVFLDVAFFFLGENIYTIEKILYGYGCSPLSAIRTLKDRTLVTIDDYNRLGMHDRIQQMAHLIVEEESENVYERSRLSCLEDVSSLLMMMGEEEDQQKWRVEGISLLDVSKIEEEIYLKPNVFKRFCHLRILKFCVPWSSHEQVVRLCGDQLDYLPSKLWYLRWDCFPFNNWPSTFYAKHLVELRLCGSKLEYLWSGEMELGKLKVIDLSYSKRLQTCPNLSRATNIEEINLEGCESLIEFSSDLRHLTKLTHLNFSCKKLQKFPDLPPKLLHLRLSATTMIKLPLEMKLLNLECTVTQMIGIWGLHGVGKTTFAKSIFEKCFHEFDYSCFLENVGDKHRKLGDIGLQKELLNKIFGGFDEDIHTAMDRRVLIRNRLRNKRVLIVLDDVFDLEYLNLLGISLKLFNHGSRIIITTPDVRLLSEGGVRCIYRLHPLDHDESLELFSRYAFEQDQPPKDFLALSYGFIEYAKGFPLALRLLGLLVYGLGIHDWQSELERFVLKRSERFLYIQDLMFVLRMSYEGLKDYFVKKVFLDIAFFFIEESEVTEQKILDRYDVKQRDAIHILKERGLITSDNDGVHMHGLIQDVAQEIESEKSLFPSSFLRNDVLYDWKQLNVFAKNLEWFGHGSRNIITSSVSAVDFFCSDASMPESYRRVASTVGTVRRRSVIRRRSIMLPSICWISSVSPSSSGDG